MGMFDTIEVHRKLPWAVVDGVEAKDIKDLKKLVNWKEIHFQTKSLDNYMEHYRIAVNGKLYVQRANYKEVEKRGISKASPTFPILEIDGKPWFEAALKVPTSIVFYESVVLEPFDYWVEFEGIFLCGKLEKIKLVAVEKTSSEPRIANELRFKEELERGNKMRQRPWYRIYNAVWGVPLSGVFKLGRSSISTLSRFLVKMEKFLIPW
jgi:hypothetical protein